MSEPSSTLETFRDSELPPDATIALLLADPQRSILVAHEIQRIQRGEIAPLQVDIDQVSAFVLLSYLAFALETSGPNQARPVVEKFVAGLEAAVGRTCPEIADVWEAAQPKQGGPNHACQ